MDVVTLPPARTLLAGLSMVESARWHDDRLWLADRGAGEVLAIDLDGKAGIDRAAEVQARRSARVLVTDLPASG